jgi:hypothetical protein
MCCTFLVTVVGLKSKMPTSQPRGGHFVSQKTHFAFFFSFHPYGGYHGENNFNFSFFSGF